MKVNNDPYLETIQLELMKMNDKASMRYDDQVFASMRKAITTLDDKITSSNVSSMQSIQNSQPPMKSPSPMLSHPGTASITPSTRLESQGSRNLLGISSPVSRMSQLQTPSVLEFSISGFQSRELKPSPKVPTPYKDDYGNYTNETIQHSQSTYNVIPTESNSRYSIPYQGNNNMAPQQMSQRNTSEGWTTGGKLSYMEPGHGNDYEMIQNEIPSRFFQEHYSGGITNFPVQNQFNHNGDSNSKSRLTPPINSYQNHLNQSLQDSALQDLSLQLSHTEHQLRSIGQKLLHKVIPSSSASKQSPVQKLYQSFSPNHMFPSNNFNTNISQMIKTTPKKDSTSNELSFSPMAEKIPESPTGRVHSKRAALQFIQAQSANPQYNMLVDSMHANQKPEIPFSSSNSKDHTVQKSSTSTKTPKSARKGIQSPSTPGREKDSKSPHSKCGFVSPVKRELDSSFGNRVCINTSNTVRKQYPAQDHSRFKTPEPTPGPGHFDASRGSTFLEKHSSSAIFGTRKRATGPSPNPDHTTGPGQYSPNRFWLSTEKNSFRATIGNDRSKIWWQ